MIHTCPQPPSGPAAFTGLFAAIAPHVYKELGMSGWQTWPVDDVDGSWDIVDEYGEEVGNVDDQEHARRIVLAVNAHDALVRLAEAVAQDYEDAAD